MLAMDYVSFWLNNLLFYDISNASYLSSLRVFMLRSLMCYIGVSCPFHLNPFSFQLDPNTMCVIHLEGHIFPSVSQEFDPDKKKVVSKTLRFIAHYYAASLIVSVFIHAEYLHLGFDHILQFALFILFFPILSTVAVPALFYFILLSLLNRFISLRA